MLICACFSVLKIAGGYCQMIWYGLVTLQSLIPAGMNNRRYQRFPLSAVGRAWQGMAGHAVYKYGKDQVDCL